MNELNLAGPSLRPCV